MKILVVGSGGRESALVETFVKDGHKVYCLPGNAGTAALCETIPEKWDGISVDAMDSLSLMAKDLKIDLTVVGPEKHLIRGMVDRFKKHGLRIFGPHQEAAVIEGEKAWSKQFMTRYKIPTADYLLCHDALEAYQAVEDLFFKWGGLVIKPSGLTAGKGVACCRSMEEAKRAVHLIMEKGRFGLAGNSIVIEEMIHGREISLLAFCDGKKMVSMIPSQDHKRIGEGGEGPNTGGMGAYAPLPFVTTALKKEIEEKIVKPTCEGLKTEEIDYRGILYFGLMLTSKGVKILEYNCRFGDPETQVLLPLFDGDLAKVMIDCIDGKLKASDIKWKKQSATCVVMAAEGYPLNYPSGDAITGLEKAEKIPGVHLYHAGTDLNEKGEVVTAGGRVIGVTGVADTLDGATDCAYAGVKKIEYVSAYYRRDIAHQVVTAMTR